MVYCYIVEIGYFFFVWRFSDFCFCFSSGIPLLQLGYTLPFFFLSGLVEIASNSCSACFAGAGEDLGGWSGCMDWRALDFCSFLFGTHFPFLVYMAGWVGGLEILFG